MKWKQWNALMYVRAAPSSLCPMTTGQEDESSFTCMSIIFLFLCCCFFYIAVCLLLLSLFSHGNLSLSADMSSFFFPFQQRPGRGLVRCLSKQERHRPQTGPGTVLVEKATGDSFLWVPSIRSCLHLLSVSNFLPARMQNRQLHCQMRISGPRCPFHAHFNIATVFSWEGA